MYSKVEKALIDSKSDKANISENFTPLLEQVYPGIHDNTIEQKWELTNSGKVSGAFLGHRYGFAYEMIFNTLANKLNRPLRVLEIGIAKGYSLKAWSELGIVDEVIGYDIVNEIDPTVKYNTKAKAVFGPSAYLDTTILNIKNKLGTFDLIIDDGVHSWDSQEYFFIKYYQLLNPGGWLVCEDINAKSLPELTRIAQNPQFAPFYILDLRANFSLTNDDVIAIRVKE